MDEVKTDSLDPAQLERLLDVGRTLVSAHDPETVLRRVLDAARELTNARYAAIGVLDEGKRELARFIFTGISEEVREQIGDLPRGHGILGELIRHPEPLRLARISDHPRSYGFPNNHPPMETFLGAPVMIRGEVYGNIYLAEKAGSATFDERDEQLIVVLAAWAAVAIDNARSHATSDERRREAERLLRGLEANASLGREVSGATDLARVLELVVKRGRALVEAQSCLVVLDEGTRLRIAAAAGRFPAGEVGTSVTDASLVEQLRSIGGQPGPPRRLTAVEIPGLGSDAALVCPLRSRGEALGVLIAAGPELPEGFTEDDLRALDSFTTTAATAIGATRRREDERLRVAIAASERERTRWARELHDETLQELGALKVMQESALQLDDPQTMRRALSHATGQVDSLIDGLQGLITDLRPAVLDQLGVDAAVEALLDRVRDRVGLEIEADIDLGEELEEHTTRFDPELEATIYRLVQESLTNVAKHANATRVKVLLEVQGDTLTLRVDDNGTGFDPAQDSGGYGLTGMRERVELAGGSLEIGSGEGGGTKVAATLPIPAGP